MRWGLQGSRTAQFLKSLYLIGFGRLSTQLVTFILIPIATHNVGAKDYGYFDLALSYVYLLAPTLALQYELGVFRLLIDARSDLDASRRIVSSALAAVATLLLAAVCIAAIANLIYPVQHFLLIVGATVTTSLGGLLLQSLRGIGENRPYALASLVTASVNLVSTIVFLRVLHLGLPGLFLGLIVANVALVSYVVLGTRLRTLIRFSHVSRRTNAEIRSYSVPLVANGVSLWIVRASNRSVLTSIVGVAANGVFAVANQLTAVLIGAASIVNMAWTESVSLHLDKEGGQEFVSRALNELMSLFLGLGLVFIFATPLYFPHLVHPSFNEALLYIPPLTIAAVLGVLMSLLGAVYVALRLSRKVAETTIFAAILSVVMTVLLTRKWGITGASYAGAVAYLLVNIARYLDLRKRVALHLRWSVALAYAIMYSIALLAYYSSPGRFTWHGIVVSLIAMVVFSQVSRRAIIGRLESIRNQHSRK